MNKKLFTLGMVTVLSIGLAACNSADKSSGEQKQTSKATETKKDEKRKITYLGKEYTVPAKVTNIVTSSLESMEDAAVLGIKPVGAITVGGKLPEYLAKDLEGAKSVGEKMQPNFETLLQLKPDVITSSSKFPPETAEKFTKIAPTFPVSHISTNWEENLKLMGELSGKKEKAEKIIKDYKADAAKAKEQIGNTLKDKKVLVIRLRAGNLYLYPESVYFNPVIYKDLGLTVPEEIKSVKAQEAISLEKLAQSNPDYIFLQFEKSENKDKPQVLEDLQKNPIWQSINAVKDKKIFINAVDPMAQGGTAWSKTTFLKEAVKNLSK
ncbi:iron-hydroxamate ABC transporter substrate-binding protein [Bacillus cytotoxicus]|uniref:Periplasmic binding protein n=1 Tax=Bacillus cytotoxicus (strain DSM 22905 / CIP 110041 / 391-98 / NVH 391-98) TaxID=315749 RepID=A7GR89_BACCN|nr:MULTISPECIES: iron-hydroxamate ABC transporter substrate-binding protein [Bacillus cereus group]ABS22647.1 periplasmic binding protein [Bacillus cytotoxicus NVH 391-98]AWC29316.1 iron-uptake system-binding protein [Bacillus cytotoxicus]AWC33324.1 iron-uptake system-binding protein [Bacillus cytotoxicus]AWC37304.1 iron-uptake system-binding protein [Bacillus cytotoxicus]AWC41442.1 iron-uptake system-binding protein [Bacillus cytotoxicus]